MTALFQGRHHQWLLWLSEPEFEQVKSDVNQGGVAAHDCPPERNRDATMRLYRLPKGFKESELLIEPGHRGRN